MIAVDPYWPSYHHKIFKLMPILFAPQGASFIGSKKARRSMHWFRRNVRLGSLCALAALAIQLVLSFGHLHIARSTAASAALAPTTQSTSTLPDTPTKPAKHVADYCTICASIHLAGLVTAEPSSVLAPHRSGAVRLTVGVEATPSAHSGLPFNARAPPLA
jgi:hypothetical protein